MIKKNKKQKQKTKNSITSSKKKIDLDVLFHNLKYHIEIA